MITAVFAALLAVAPCPSVPGAAALFAKPGTHFVWFGEMHGTSEMPALFGDTICAAALTGRPIVVALEKPQAEQRYWDAYLKSDGSPAAEGALLEAPSWRWTTQDGRSSKAMLLLANRLREYRAHGQILDVRLIVPEQPLGSRYDPEATETKMADAVAGAGARWSNAVVVVYSGNLHAQKGRWKTADGEYNLAASHLPADQTITVDLIGASGNAWTCQEGGCGVHPYGGAAEASVRGYHMVKTPAGYDAVGYTGLATTSSPPAAAPSLGYLLGSH